MDAEGKMLVLSRCVGEVIRVGDDIAIMVTRVSGNSVRIGIEAPKSLRVKRGESQPVAEITVEIATEDAIPDSVPSEHSVVTHFTRRR